MSTQNPLHRDLGRLTAAEARPALSPRPFVAGGLVLAGLIAWSHLSKPTVPVTLFAGIDASRSQRDTQPDGGTRLGHSRELVADLAPRLVAGLDRVKVFRIDRECREFFDEPAPAGSEAFLGTLIDNTIEPPAENETRPALFWTDIAKQAASPELTPGAAIAIAAAGDADNDDLSPDSAARIAQAARELAANPRVVSVEFFGADPSNWATLRRLFAPLGARLRLHGPQEMDGDGLLARLNAARVQPARGGDAP